MKLAIVTFVSAALISGSAQEQNPPPATQPKTEKKPFQMTVEQARSGKQEDLLCQQIGYFERGDEVTVVYRIGHGTGTPHPLQDVLNNAKSGDVKVYANEAMHTLILKGKKDDVAFLQKILNTICAPQPQVHLKTAVYEVREDSNFEFGISGETNDTIWVKTAPNPNTLIQEAKLNFSAPSLLTGGPFQGTTFRFAHAGGGGNITGKLQFLQREGKATLKAEPAVVVKASESAVLDVLDKVPFVQGFTIGAGGIVTNVGLTQIDAGLKLRITPHVVGSGIVELEIDTELSSVVREDTGLVPGFKFPVLASRKVRSVLSVPEGTIIVIGGFVREETKEIVTGLPFVSDIPLVGILFKGVSKTKIRQNIIFTIQPTIVGSAEEMKRGLFNPKEPGK